MRLTSKDAEHNAAASSSAIRPAIVTATEFALMLVSYRPLARLIIELQEKRICGGSDDIPLVRPAPLPLCIPPRHARSIGDAAIAGLV